MECEWGLCVCLHESRKWTKVFTKNQKINVSSLKSTEVNPTSEGVLYRSGGGSATGVEEGCNKKSGAQEPVGRSVMEKGCPVVNFVFCGCQFIPGSFCLNFLIIHVSETKTLKEVH